MIKLSNGMEFKDAHEANLYIAGMRMMLGNIRALPEFSCVEPTQFGRLKAKSTAIAAIEVAIENAELALKSAQRKEEKMKAVKKAVKPVAKKPVTKPAAKTKAKPKRK